MFKQRTGLLIVFFVLKITKMTNYSLFLWFSLIGITFLIGISEGRLR